MNRSRPLKMQPSMKDQWNEIAYENAFYGVLSLDDFENSKGIDLNRFWETGRKDVASFMKIVGLGDTPSLTMLEIGCGIGRMTHHFSELFNKVYALDVSPAMLSRAKNYWGQLRNVEWVLGNGEDLHQIADESIDFVFSFLVLQHIPNPSIVLGHIRESARVLKNRGMAFLQFRTIPKGVSLIALKYHVSTHWPFPVSNFLRRMWDLIHRPKSTSARFARNYESWRGCALKPSLIETVASESQLRVRSKAALGEKYTYYIFSKTCGP